MQFTVTTELPGLYSPPWPYDQQLVNLAFEVIRTDQIQGALRLIAESYVASFFPTNCAEKIEVAA